MARKPWLVISVMFKSETAERNIQCVVGKRPLRRVKRRKQMPAGAGKRSEILEHIQHLPGQRHRVRLLHLHPFGRHTPHLFRKIDPAPFFLPQFAWSQEDVRRDPQCMERLRPSFIVVDRAQQLADLLRFDDRSMVFDLWDRERAAEDIRRIALGPQSQSRSERRDPRKTAALVPSHDARDVRTASGRRAIHGASPKRSDGWRWRRGVQETSALSLAWRRTFPHAPSSGYTPRRQAGASSWQQVRPSAGAAAFPPPDRSHRRVARVPRHAFAAPAEATRYRRFLRISTMFWLCAGALTGLTSEPVRRRKAGVLARREIRGPCLAHSKFGP